MTWNIEGLRRNIFNLKHFLDLYEPDLVFLSEPQIYECDIGKIVPFLSDYSHYLNSPDKYSPDLPLLRSKACGGTMLLVKRHLEPHIVVIPSLSSSYLPILLQPPGFSSSIHVCIYLPTHGKDKLFLEELANLSDTLCHIRIDYPHVPVFLRGDFNVNENNFRRMNVLDTFKIDEDLIELPTLKPTYHHFMGNGSSDSKLDKIIHSKHVPQPEILQNHICKLSHPLVDSHHDILISICFIHHGEQPIIDPNNVTAPTIVNTRHKIKWSDDGIRDYQSLVLPQLKRLQNIWMSVPPSLSSISILHDSTCNVLTTCAKATNVYQPLPYHPHENPRSIPRDIRLSSQNLQRRWSRFKSLKRLHDQNSDTFKTELKALKKSQI